MSFPHSFAHFRTERLSSHANPQSLRFAKARRPLGDPISFPKNDPRFEPPPPTNLMNLELPLSVVLPNIEQDAQAAGKLIFHSVGDTGGIHGDAVQTAVSRQMETQLSAKLSDRPQFFYNLGDVVYFNGQSELYNSQFYEPNQYYNAPIFAIPGNHDGDTQVRSNDPIDREISLYGFMLNFCDSAPHKLSPYRATMTQPYCYWVLQAPFATIIGLYSNVEGLLDARQTNEQQRWFENEISNSPTDKALIIAVHHPPYSLDSTHGGYQDIGNALDRAMKTTGRLADAVLSGHVHNYQRFTRTIGNREIPYVVAGAGGYANTQKLMHKIQRDAKNKPIKAPYATTLPDVRLESCNEDNPGFLKVSGDSKTIKIDYFVVPFDGLSSSSLFDSVTIKWR